MQLHAPVIVRAVIGTVTNTAKVLFPNTSIFSCQCSLFLHNTVHDGVKKVKGRFIGPFFGTAAL
jgi:hypothetical protein